MEGSLPNEATLSDTVLVDELPSALVCSICHGCPFSPKQCRKGHIFCDRCITKWLQLEATCPLDRVPLSPADLSDNLLAKSLIAKLRVRCSNWTRSSSAAAAAASSSSSGAASASTTLSSSDGGLSDAKRVKLVEAEGGSGCPWVGPLDTLEAHTKECPFQVVPCSFVCGEALPRREMAEHVEKCVFAPQACELCQAQVMRCRFDEHKLQCPARIVSCEFCKWRGPHHSLEAHSVECPGATVECDICEVTMLRSQLEAHLMSSMTTHFPLLLGKAASLQKTVLELQNSVSEIKSESDRNKVRVASLRSKLRAMTKPIMVELPAELMPQGEHRVFTFRVPDADRTHYGPYVGFSNVNCAECGRSSMQIGFVAERLRPHEAQDDQLGRWVGVEFEKGHVPSVKGSIWIRFQVFRSADAALGVSFTHNYNSEGTGLDFDSDRGARVGDRWGFIWGRSILLTDMTYANALGPHGSLFVKYYVRFIQAS